MNLDAYQAMELAGALRQTLIEQQESFVFETVLSDPVGNKLEFLGNAQRRGFTVVLCFIGLDSAETSEERVAMRVLQGGHDVPNEKIASRFPRTLANLKRAIAQLEGVLVFDNSDLARPFRKVAEFRRGRPVFLASPPAWLKWK
ncbi:MAG: zeta toxin family protein [Myxococcales bacterium]